ncbi:MAG: hypothetical protein IKM04_08285 [Clostridia bacterium]|nr:hypothetical protein [Clostridia bacterium]
MFEKHCITCNAVLKSDEIPLYKKMVNRGATEYMCIPCLAKKLRVTEESLYEAIERFREMGCTLF